MLRENKSSFHKVFGIFNRGWSFKVFFFQFEYLFRLYEYNILRDS